MNSSIRILVISALFFVLAGKSTTSALAAEGDTKRVSISSSGGQGNRISGDNFISSNGQHIAFSSDATNLVSGDTNAKFDVFVRDLLGGLTTRASISSSGVQSNGVSGDPSISSDGRYIVFYSYATNLVAGDTNGFNDVFMHDNQTGATVRVSVDSSGNQASSSSSSPHISADGRYTVFLSSAPNLVSGDTYDGILDVFLHDNLTGSTVRISVNASGHQTNGDSYNPYISADGRYVTYDSYATNLVSGDTNASSDVFIYDTQTGITDRVSIDSAGVEGNGDSFSSSVSINGRYIAFGSLATNLVSGDTNAKRDIFLHDHLLGTTIRVSVNSTGVQGNDRSFNPIISADGRFIAFDSLSTNLVDGDTNALGDIFMYDRLAAINTRISVSSSGEQASGGSSEVASISYDGQFIGFDSSANNLVSGDTNGVIDVFIHENTIAKSTYVVNTNNSGPGSLRQVISDASNADTITFDSSLSGQTIQLQSTLIIDKSIVIDASALSEKIILSGDSDNDGNGDILILNILANQVVTIKNIEFTKGYTSNTLNAGAIANLGNLSIYDSEFVSNQGGQGGAIRNSGQLLIENSSFTSNTATEGGGVFNELNKTLTITGSTFSNNSAIALPGPIGGAAGAIANIGAVNIENSTFLNNQSHTGGGAIVNSLSGNAAISNSTFTDNTTFGNGGAINNFEGTMTIGNSTFTDNAAINYSGGAISNSAQITINESSFSTNQANFGSGGAVVNSQIGTMLINGSSISENTSSYGAGIMNLGSAEITNTEISANSATQGGGGILNGLDGNGTLSFSNGTISGNSAPYGGGVFNLANNGSVTLESCSITGNTSTDSGSGHGGGASNFFQMTINNCTIANNSAPHYGGGIFSAGTLTVNNSTISNNSALNSGGIEFYGTLSLKNTIIANSTSGKDCFSSSGTMTQNVNNLIEDNAVSPNQCGTPSLTSNPNLGALANNGGTTQTMALLIGSPAIDAGHDASCINTDQRGTVRPQGMHCDIGAFEYVDITAPIITTIARGSTSPTSASSVDFTVTLSESAQNVDVNDFSLTATGVSGASVTSIIPVSTSVYTITVNTGSGNGTIRLDVPNTATIKDLSNNDLSGLPYTSGEVYTIEKSTPLPAGWVGSVSVTSDKNLVSVGRPHIGAEVASYSGFASGSTTAFVPMLFKDAFGGDYDAALYVQNVSGSSASVTIEFYDNSGSLNCTKTDTIASLASKGYWLPSLTCTSGSLPPGWVGGVKVTSDQPIVAVGRPHIGSEVMTYNGFTAGSTSAFIPMLFKAAFGGSYNAAFYVQNVSGSSASVTLEYFDNTGALNCTKADTIAPLASKGYWVPAATCDSGSLPAGWVGGVRVTSSQPIVTVGRPHIDTQITTYDGFSAGSPSSYVPMLFKGAFGGSYNAAFYVQNVSGTSANVTIKYYDNAGTLNCTKADTIAPLASKGYWVPSATCDSGSLPAGWVGGVEVTSDQPIVSVGRPHIDAQVTTYNGIPAGTLSLYLPMLFKDAFGGSYDSAFYLQNTEATAATVTIQFYDSTGALTCSRTDTIQSRATLGFWVPAATCFP